ncbi:MAG: hypothetical protein ACRCSB_01565 [Bacteroidales bacterium]
MKKTQFLLMAFSIFTIANAVLGQTAPKMPFHTTILSTNTDLVNKLLLVEFANIPLTSTKSCLNYTLAFRLKHNETELGRQPIKVISTPVWYTGKKISDQCFYNQNEFNGGPGALTCQVAPFDAEPAAKLRRGDTLIYDMRQSAYHIAFKLGDDIAITDSIRVSVEEELYPTVCRGCGVHGSDRIFDPTKDIVRGCPQQGTDFQACYRRQSRERNWEAWIIDARDCKYYRTVRMPDNRWWLAQNLNYQGTASKPLVWHAKPGTYTGTSATERFRSYSCPGGPALPASGVLETASFADLKTEDASPKIACETYGAFYPQLVAITTDGFSTGTEDASRPKDIPGHENMAASKHRGVCPQGWLYPTLGDWGKMANLVERNCGSLCPVDGSNSSETGATGTTSACVHRTFGNASHTCLLRDLSATSLAPARLLKGDKLPSNGDASIKYPDTTHLVSTNTEAIWSYFGQEHAGTDRYGFALLPAGYGNPGALKYHYRGLNTMIGLANIGVDGSTATGPVDSSRGHIWVYYFYNSIQPGFSGGRLMGGSSAYNLSVRCIR